MMRQCEDERGEDRRGWGRSIRPVLYDKWQVLISTGGEPVITGLLVVADRGNFTVYMHT